MSLPWEKLQQKVEKKKVLVFGLGRQGGGIETANTLVAAGAIVRANDQKTAEELGENIKNLHEEVEAIFGKQEISDIEWADIIVKNPGVPNNHPLIKEALLRGKVVTNEAALTIEILRERTIGITGTRGKTTTTSLVHHILQDNGIPALLGGNIPHKPSISLLKEATEESWLVLELSSFQIEAFDYRRLSPHISLVTNIYPDHLDRYENEMEYALTKATLFRWQRPGDHAISGSHYELSSLIASQIPNVSTVHILGKEDFEAVPSNYPSSLPGNHNSENIAFAAEVGKIFKLPDEQIANAVKSFQGVPYRLEKVAEKNGITYINDTTSTTPTALEKALDTLQGERFILIAGGTTKRLPLPETLIAKLQSVPADTVWLQGSGSSEILEKLNYAPNTLARSMDEAVSMAQQKAAEQGATTILLSPGFSSFELFKNEFDRGDQFNQIALSA